VTNCGKQANCFACGLDENSGVMFFQQKKRTSWCPDRVERRRYESRGRIQVPQPTHYTPSVNGAYGVCATGVHYMEIESTLTNRSHQTLKVIYSEDNPSKDLDGKILQGVHAYCFYKDQLVIVYAKEKGYWTPPGGGIESGESFEGAVIREVKEETNMKVMHHEFIGYQDIYELNRIVRQTRSFCIVEPLGDFITDPDGDITEIKLIDPKDYKQYFDWGKIGDRIMKRAMELKGNFLKNNGTKTRTEN